MINNKQLSKIELRKNKISRDEFPKLKRNPIYLILDNLKSAHNIGTILRLSDALLVEKVFICGDSPVPPKRRVIKGSLGAEKWVNWEHNDNIINVICKLKGLGVSIVSAEMSSTSIDYRSLVCKFPIGLVLGREDRGICQEVLSLSDKTVCLPMLGMMNSLNVSTVAAALLFNMIKI